MTCAGCKILHKLQHVLKMLAIDNSNRFLCHSADSHIFQRKILTFLNKTNVKRHNDINVKTIKQMNVNN